MPVSYTQTLNISRSGMLARLLDLDVVSNNLSNVNTTGYKRSRGNFQEILSQKQLEGTRIRATQNIMEQGSIYSTTNPLDLAINGDGFFSVTLPDERIAYTRNGEFYVDASNRLVDNSGHPIVWDGELPERIDDIHVNPDGTVMVQANNEWTQVGQIPVSRFPNPSGLYRFGQNLWLESTASGAVEDGVANSDNFGAIMGNVLERSNVNLAEEMVQMINLQRSFQMSLRSFQQTDQMLSQAILMRRA